MINGKVKVNISILRVFILEDSVEWKNINGELHRKMARLLNGPMGTGTGM